MADIPARVPADIFTEQDADPDTLSNLGPLTRLAGIWESPKDKATGHDINPKADGPEHRDYYERIELQPIDAQSNGPQLLYGLRYHTRIVSTDEEITFHEQVGHWMWEPKTGLIIQSLAIPRGQTALATGFAKPGDDKLVLTATRGTTGAGISSIDFLEQAFRTDSYKIEVTFHPDGAWSYVLETMLMVRGQGPEPFLHRDENRLIKVAEPRPNPLAVIKGARVAL
jgi:hypothetical protein